MRSCFVPWCDSICKKHQKRMMFLPPKNKEAFEAWRKVLPKKKELKSSDKICERHFRKEDIITTFDHVINGQLFQMERGRPKLKPNSIPRYNLPSEDEEKLYFKAKARLQRVRRVRMCKILKLEVQQLEDKEDEQKEEKNKSNSEENDKSNERDQSEERKKFIEEGIFVGPDDDDDEHDKKDEESKKDMDEEEVMENSLQVNTQVLYDILYDDVYEVILPSTLWGVHRDPERAFITFSYFDPDSMEITKLIILDCKGILKVYISNKLVKEKTLTIEISHELLSNIIAQIDMQEDSNK